jgi:hypothetical protein
MAYAIIHFFPDGTKEQYEASIAAVHPNRKALPLTRITEGTKVQSKAVILLASIRKALLAAAAARFANAATIFLSPGYLIIAITLPGSTRCVVR